MYTKVFILKTESLMVEDGRTQEVASAYINSRSYIDIDGNLISPVGIDRKIKLRHIKKDYPELDNQKIDAHFGAGDYPSEVIFELLDKMIEKAGKEESQRLRLQEMYNKQLNITFHLQKLLEDLPKHGIKRRFISAFRILFKKPLQGVYENSHN